MENDFLENHMRARENLSKAAVDIARCMPVRISEVRYVLAMRFNELIEQGYSVESACEKARKMAVGEIHWRLVRGY